MATIKTNLKLVSGRQITFGRSVKILNPGAHPSRRPASLVCVAIREVGVIGPACVTFVRKL